MMTGTNDRTMQALAGLVSALKLFVPVLVDEGVLTAEDLGIERAQPGRSLSSENTVMAMAKALSGYSNYAGVDGRVPWAAINNAGRMLAEAGFCPVNDCGLRGVVDRIPVPTALDGPDPTKWPSIAGLTKCPVHG